MKIVGLQAVDAAACALLAACSSGPSQPSVQASHEKLACEGLADATTEFSEMTTLLAQVQVTLNTSPAGYFTAAFTSAEQAVVHAPVKPTPTQVAALQRQCDSVGVTGRVWSAVLTGES